MDLKNIFVFFRIKHENVLKLLIIINEIKPFLKNKF